MTKTKVLTALPLAVFLVVTACSDDAPVEERDVGSDVYEADVGDDVIVDPDLGTDTSGDVATDVGADVTTEHDAGVFGVVDETERWTMLELSGPVYVVRTAGNVPHIYGENDVDVARVHGFVAAQDRYFMMDMARRLALGTISELLGDVALGNDIQARLTGSRHVAHRLLETAQPEMVAVMEAYAEGINRYIEEVTNRALPLPSEVALTWRILGQDHRTSMMKPFEALDVAAIFATFIYQTSFSRDAIGRTSNHAQLQAAFQTGRFAELRRAGAFDDIWNAPHPIIRVSSGQWGPLDNMPSTGLEGGPTVGPVLEALRPEASLLDRLDQSLDAQHERSGWRNDERGFGSNAWAVSGAHTPDGASLLAGDGHLALGTPPILYAVGLDTSVLGGTNAAPLFGLVIPGMPYVGQGTNGKIAWASTQLFGDITDYYVEELRLDEDGRPFETLFEDEWHAMEAIDETYVIAPVTLLESRGRTEVWTRWQTFDGRWLVDIEGTPVSPDAEVGAGESVVRTHSGWVIPRDLDGDGKITAITMAFAGLQVDDLTGTFAKFARAENVLDFREHAKGLQASSFNFTVADSSGDIYYSSFQATPCRSYLPRDGNGGWIEGADPTMLLDGTRYGNFTIPTIDGVVDDSHQDDPYRCVVPYDQFPHNYNPEQGYVLTANNDPADIAFDSNLFSAPFYIGGPWYPGLRADTIDRGLAAAIAEERADVEAMANLQGNAQSPLGRLFTPALFDALVMAEELFESGITTEAWEARLLEDYTSRRERIQEVAERLQAWGSRGFHARSGVETFYANPTQDDRDDAVATMIFNAYFRALNRLVLDDENFPGIWQRGGSVGRVRLLYEMLTGRGQDNPLGLASHNPETGESVYFDNRNTELLERSDELMVRAVLEALDFLESAPDGPGKGGFGTEDMDAWLWGLRHQVRFESLLGGVVGNEPGLEALFEGFSITTERLPLAEDIGEDDPRRGLVWFPRDGDQFGVDAANPGISGTNFTYSSGPVMRMVIALRDGEVWGRNIIPGGQSGIIASEFFDDQAALWLGNDTMPIHYHLEDVLENALGRETFLP